MQHRTAYFVAGICALLSAAAAAHDLKLTDTLIVLKTDGTYQVDMTCDLDALALGAPTRSDSAELAERLRALSPEELNERLGDLRRYFERRIRIRFDDQPSLPRVTFPDHGTSLAGAIEPASVLGLTARLEGQVPPGAGTLTFRASRSFPPVHLTILDQSSLQGRRELLELGVPSSPHALGQPRAVPGRAEVAGRYLILGFKHILPAGPDHILFVLGLFLLSARWRPLLWQVTAFTAAHAVTLTLATYGAVRLAPSIVEPLIALSIVWIAVENVFTSELKPWRPVLVFAFGLLHGLGFAGVLDELGLPEGELLTALLTFNAGIELGQLTVLGVAFATAGWWRKRPWYRSRIAIPSSLLIAAAGLYWTTERLLAGSP